jgi:hypothetical protein
MKKEFCKVSVRVEKIPLKNKPQLHNYVFRFGLPPLFSAGNERGRIRLDLPEWILTNYCVFYFGREPALEPRRILIVNKSEVYVEKMPAYPAPVNGVWIARIEVSPLLFEDC